MLRDSPFSYQLIWQDDSKVGLSYIHILAPFLKSQFAVMPPPFFFCELIFPFQSRTYSRE